MRQASLTATTYCSTDGAAAVYKKKLIKLLTNLNLLAETGEIRKLTCGDGAVHFDGDTRQHYHFVCSECNQVYDMELGAMEDLNKEAQEHAPGIIDSHYVLFYGRCNSCLQKKVDKAIDKPA